VDVPEGPEGLSFEVWRAGDGSAGAFDSTQRRNGGVTIRAIPFFSHTELKFRIQTDTAFQ
jgi:hypothetical protein